MSLFDPADWIELPEGVAVHRRDCRPCPCGSRRFDVLRRAVEGGPAMVRACVPARPGEAKVGVLDVDAWRFVATRRTAG